jgi:hypothetical protein
MIEIKAKPEILERPAAILDFTGVTHQPLLDKAYIKEHGLKIALYLDDTRTPSKPLPDETYMPWIVVRDFKEFATFIANNGVPDFISFDHDLHQEHYAPVEFWEGNQYEHWAATKTFKHETGLDCMKWLILWCESHRDEVINLVTIHSFNKTRAVDMQTNMNEYKKRRGWDQNCFYMIHEFTEN